MPFRILLADDHVIVRQGLRGLLERAGFEVVGEAGDGQEAICLAKEKHPDVAVLDIGMPVLNGIDAARGIRKVCGRTRSLTGHMSWKSCKSTTPLAWCATPSGKA